MQSHATTPDPILESFEAAAKPPATVEELTAIVRDFATRLIADPAAPPDVVIAAGILLDDLEGKTDAWHNALDEAWRAAEVAA